MVQSRPAPSGKISISEKIPNLGRFSEFLRISQNFSEFLRIFQNFRTFRKKMVSSPYLEQRGHTLQQSKIILALVLHPTVCFCSFLQPFHSLRSLHPCPTHHLYSPVSPHPHAHVCLSLRAHSHRPVHRIARTRTRHSSARAPACRRLAFTPRRGLGRFTPRCPNALHHGPA